MVPIGWFLKHGYMNGAIKITMAGTYLGLVVPISSIAGFIVLSP